MRTFRITVFLLCFACLFFTSCTTSALFYWGNYSQTSYNMKKNPDEKHREAHKKELLAIMEKSEKKKLKVPPGIYCEYGYLMHQDGNNDDALKYFELEETAYPESKTFTQRLRSMVTGAKTAAAAVKSEEADDASEGAVRLHEDNSLGKNE